MVDVDTLLKQFIAEHEAGGDADPRAYLEQVEGGDRSELSALIEGYLMRAPRRAWDPSAYERSGAPAMVDALSRSLEGAGGLWPSLLPRLRERARLKRSELVAELAARLGAEGSRAKVERYYHEMENGLLPEEGVSDTVLDALGQIVGQSKEALRRAGQAFGPGMQTDASSPAFTRTTGVPAAHELRAQPAPEPSEEWDEVDRLFRGGRPSGGGPPP